MTKRLIILLLSGLAIGLNLPASAQTGHITHRMNPVGEVLQDAEKNIVTHPRGNIYKAGSFKRLWLGNNYREEWITPIEIPHFQFRNEYGKMEIVRVGGNFQTRTLVLEDALGKEWVLRSIDKDASSRIPEILRTEIAKDLVQDQMSASHPYAALAIPRMADAAGIFHTNPRLVYLSEKSLSAYDKRWEGIYLFEERPDDNWDDKASFGYSKDIISTRKMLEEVREGPEARVDQELFLKSRLMDMLVSDWDRHEDQWRWASFKHKDKVIYKPIPRDRDMVFFVNEGILPRLSTRRFLLRKIQGLDYEINDIKGLNSQAQHLDRRFLNELTRKDWIHAAEKLQADIGDKVIDSSLGDLPSEVSGIHDEVIAAKLKARRDKLDTYADKYYSILAKAVDIVGTEEEDYFRVKRMNDSETRVRVYSIDKHSEPDHMFYERVFRYPETKEIRLFGLSGDDIYKITGQVEKGIRIQIIGGAGMDEVKDNSRVKGTLRKTIAYDTREGIQANTSNETRMVLSHVPEKYTYNYSAFSYNKFIPLIYAGYTYDDGVYLGGGFAYTSFDFKKTPYAAKHHVSLKYSLATEAKEMEYMGSYPDILNDMDFHLQFYIRDPKFTQNYFGMGNETNKLYSSKDYYRVRIEELFINPELSHSFSPRTSFSAGLFYQNSRIEASPERFITDTLWNDLDPEIYDRKQFLGISGGFKHDSRDNEVYPTRGMYWEARNQFYYNLTGSAYTFDRISGEISMYTSPLKSNGHVAAFRLGGAINTGDYEFYQANTLGSKHNLRGFPYSRYSGYASIYQNTDLRIKLSRVKSYATRGYFGLILFNDVGRVWEKNEDSHTWHHGYGGGLWVSPYEMAIISATVEFSREEKNGLFSLRFGFLF